MATQQLVWFTNGTEKYFTTEAAALAYERQMDVQQVIAGTGINPNAAKKAAKAVVAHFEVSDKEEKVKAEALASPAIEEPGIGTPGE